MAKPLKVSNAVCPKCFYRNPLDENGRYERHIIYGDKLPSGEHVNSVCDGSGLKADRPALRMERKRLRTLEAIKQRYLERQRLRKELAPEVERLRSGKGVNAEIFTSLLKAYGLWETIPARRKWTIRHKLMCLNYDGTFINTVMRGGRPGKGVNSLAKDLLNALI